MTKATVAAGPSDITMTTSRTTCDAVRCLPICGVCSMRKSPTTLWGIAMGKKKIEKHVCNVNERCFHGYSVLSFTRPPTGDGGMSRDPAGRLRL